MCNMFDVKIIFLNKTQQPDKILYWKFFVSAIKAIVITIAIMYTKLCDLLKTILKQVDNFFLI